jgi:hypothetical protein
LDKKIKSSKYLISVPDENAITADSPIPFSINQLWFELIDIEQKTFNERDLTDEALEEK